MISTDALQVGFLSLLTIVNEESSLTIVNEGSSLTIVNEGLSLSYMQEKVVGKLKLLDTTQ